MALGHQAYHGGRMIARIWSGTVRQADAEEYAEYIRRTGFSKYAETPGNHGAWMLRRDEDGCSEFITLSHYQVADHTSPTGGDASQA